MKKFHVSWWKWGCNWIFGIACVLYMTYDGVFGDSQFVRDWLPPLAIISGFLHLFATHNSGVLAGLALKNVQKFGRGRLFPGHGIVDVLLYLVAIFVLTDAGWYWTAAGIAATAYGDAKLYDMMAAVWEALKEPEAAQLQQGSSSDNCDCE